jgi:hypothetical protein
MTMQNTHLFQFYVHTQISYLSLGFCALPIVMYSVSFEYCDDEQTLETY